MFPRPAIFVSVVLVFGLAAPGSGAPLDSPGVSVVSTDRTSITLEVQAGATGAPAGFIIEWMPAHEYLALGGWPSSSAALCGSSFTGVPTLHVTPGVPSFRLDPGQAATVVLGEFFDETGLEAENREELGDGLEYVVRARAAAGAGFEASGYSATVTCATPPRTSTDCTVSQGYWKNHPESWSRVASLTLGSVTYSQDQLLAILRQPARGNGLVSLAHQLIATRLNMLLGAIPTLSVGAASGQADALIGSRRVPPVGGGWLSPSATGTLTFTLRAFNSGRVGPGRCPDNLHVLPATAATWGTLKAVYR